MRKTLYFLAALVALNGAAMAQTKTFKIGDAGGMKASQMFQFESDADFENFTGVTHKLGGQFKFDPKARTGSGEIEVDIASIDTGIPMRNEHLRSPMWFDAAKFPTAKFETTSVKHKKGDTYTVSGKLTVHGVTRNITTEADIRYIAESAATRKAMFKGDICRITCDFKVNLKDYGVMIPDMAAGKVSPSINLRLDVFAYTG
ncbi:MAG TPA: YceI family protein [Fimbriimonadaceae bacterium]|nr:YceI family protein [Fimbriimonadaceae bacterium]